MGKFKLDTSQAIAEIRKIIAEFNSLKKSTKQVADSSVENFERIDNSLKGIKEKVALLGNKINYLEAIMKKNNASLNANSSANKKNAAATTSNAASKTKLGKSTDSANASTKKFSKTLSSLLKAGGILQLGQELYALTKNIYENVKTFDSLSYTLEKITENTFDYENSQKFLLRITKAYGVELVATTTRWTRFLAAAKESGLSLRDTENIFESLTKASAVLGLKTDELSSVYLALEQMLSKGKVTTEELRRQLGERLPGAMGIMAASMGVTIPVLDKMLKKGQVLSAEVLPDFAEAVERAYGIENADRIETLISKQNRLTAAWQTFIKNVSEGDSTIKKVFGGFLEFLEETIDLWDKLLMSTNQKLRIDIGLEEKRFSDGLKKSSDQYIDFKSSVENQEIALNLKESNLKDQLKTATGEEREVIKNGLDEIARIRALKGKESVARQKEIARDRIDVAYNEYQEAKAIFEKQEKDDAERAKNDSFFARNTEASEAYKNLVKFEAQYNVLRKLVDESDVKILPDDEPDVTQKKLRAIKDYYLETINEISKGVLEANKERASDETLDVSARLEAIKKAAEMEIFIRNNTYEITKRDSQAALDKEVESVNDAVEKGSLSREKADAHIRALETEKNDYLRKEAVKLSNDLIAINNKASESAGTLTTNFNEESQLSAVEDLFNKKIIAAKEEYNQSKKTNADKIKLEKALAEAAIDSTNEIIDVKIKLLNEEIDLLSRSGDANSEYINKLKQEVNSLEATKKVKPPIDTADWKAVFEEAIDLASEFTGAIGDFVDATFERRIENINAEIAAEEEKYDKLIALAEGDEEQQATLARNKEDRIKKLEKERLKQEQKQAKAKKKFAIADIAISTAKAIMGIWADFPKFDFGATAAIMTGVVSALGAAQIAAVVASPIPQYKDGVKNLSRDEIAMINDGGYKEFIERNNKILTSDKKNAIVPLKKGDTVYKNYDDMVKNSSLFNIKDAVPNIKVDNGNLLYGITGAIKDGLKDVKINNDIKLNNIIKNDNYKESLSRW